MQKRRKVSMIQATHSYNNTNSYNTTTHNLSIRYADSPTTTTSRAVSSKYKLDLKEQLQKALEAAFYIMLMQTLMKNNMFDILNMTRYHRTIDWRA